MGVVFFHTKLWSHKTVPPRCLQCQGIGLSGLWVVRALVCQGIATECQKSPFHPDVNVKVSRILVSRILKKIKIKTVYRMPAEKCDCLEKKIAFILSARVLRYHSCLWHKLQQVTECGSMTNKSLIKRR